MGWNRGWSMSRWSLEGLLRFFPAGDSQVVLNKLSDGSVDMTVTCTIDFGQNPGAFGRGRIPTGRRLRIDWRAPQGEPAVSMTCAPVHSSVLPLGDVLSRFVS